MVFGITPAFSKTAFAQKALGTPLIPIPPHRLRSVVRQDNTRTFGTIGSIVGAQAGVLAQQTLGSLRSVLPISRSRLGNSFANSTGSAAVQPNRPTFAFEQVAAVLQPFDLLNFGQTGLNQGPQGINQSVSSGNNALGPIIQTNGLVFPYNPEISEGVRIKYDVVELTHRNESYYAYKATDNVRIGLANCIWTCDTFENAVYTLSVLHFLRRYRFMDFGRGKTGRPPRPMWFRAYGNYTFYRVPVLLEKADWNFPRNNDMDYVGIPEFGRDEYATGQLATTKSTAGNYTWLPIKFTANINLIVQHSPSYWTNWSLLDYRNGDMLRRDNTFHKTGRSNRSAGGGGQNIIPTRGIPRLLSNINPLGPPPSGVPFAGAVSSVRQALAASGPNFLF